MGFVSNVLVQGIISFVIIGSLKRAGVVRVEPRAIENPGLRTVFEQGVSFGESVALAGERIVSEFKKA
ncbi:hypothetical protein C2E20_3264 [Micractinium conductrix]|uniref:Uncharacterized protein n=1 Tax=Micractinium conductrix TaxID=554055 RepID=A0A2P6VH22_9CHLO|nr:hypothetical protein C2E20_3264 [Micractinium conductrix]|eukprot:PSC73385.1 hypothetical protein C2E20_3264 [Micractinium conductrix]